MKHTNISINALQCLLFSFVLLFLFPHGASPSGLTYTIQTGSFDTMDRANSEFDALVDTLQESEMDHLRIEQIGNYYCVRMGTFEAYDDALSFFHTLEAIVPDAIVLEAYIKEERVRRAYPDASPAAENQESAGEEHQSADEFHLQEEEDNEGVVTSDPVIQKKETDRDSDMNAVSMPAAIKSKDDRLSLSMQDADIHSVLKALSIKKNLNIVTSKDVSGKISVNVHNLPLNEVLDAVITINGFNYVEKDNIIFVTKGKGDGGENFLDEEVRIFRLRYADMDEVEKVISSLLSESAKITLYKPRKTLIIEDVPQNLDAVSRVLAALDVAPRQVLIETKILQVRLNDDTSLGIDWSETFDGFFNSSGQVFTQGFTGAAQGFFFNLVNSDLNLFLEALQNITEVETLSSPSLLALDREEATIIIGEKLGYYVTTATEATVLQSVEFLDTGTQLKLIPQIIDDNRVIMKIHPEVSDGIVIDGLPSKNTAEVTTSLMAPNGGTIFIGGLIRDRKEDIKDRVPGLGAVPVFGALFGRTTNITTRTEIVVLITPHVISPANERLLERDTENVKRVEEDLAQERSLKELVPGLH